MSATSPRPDDGCGPAPFTDVPQRFTDDPLLSVSSEALPLRRALMAATWQMFLLLETTRVDLTLEGHRTAWLARERLLHPGVGDLVMVLPGGQFLPGDECFGRLVARRNERSAAGWVTASYVRYAPGPQLWCRWVGADRLLGVLNDLA